MVGLLVDERGFPVQLHSFEGNKAETLTLVPVLNAFRTQYPGVTVSVACDAMSRHIQEATEVSVKRFAKVLALVKDAVIVVEVNEHRIPAAVTDGVAGLLDELGDLGLSAGRAVATPPRA